MHKLNKNHNLTPRPLTSGLHPLSSDLRPLTSSSAFTLIELIVAIAVIAILASIVGVSYGYVMKKVQATTLQSDVSSIASLVKSYRNFNNLYPLDIPSVNSGSDINSDPDHNTVVYNVSHDQKAFCASATSDNQSYYVDSTIDKVQFGSCAGIFGIDAIVTPSDTVFAYDLSAPGCDSSRTIQLPIVANANNSKIHWGDGSVEDFPGSSPEHTYSGSKDVVYVAYDGPMGRVSSDSISSERRACLTHLMQFGGEAKPASMLGAFDGSTNFVYTAEPPVTVTNMVRMFAGAKVFNQPIGHWDTSRVTDLGAMFMSAEKFNQDLSMWDTSQNTNMYQMFYKASVFNSDINGWDTSKVTNMERLFAYAYEFNQRLDSWDVSGASNFIWMFREARAFNKPLATWDMSNAVEMSFMFDSTPFNQDISSWDVSKAKSVSYMFRWSSFNQNIANWDVSAVVSSTGFHSGSPLTQANCPPSLW